MERAHRFENNMFELQVNSIRKTTGTPRQPNMDDDGAIAISFGEPNAEKDYELLLRYAARAEPRYHRAINQLSRLQNLLYSRGRPLAL